MGIDGETVGEWVLAAFPARGRIGVLVLDHRSGRVIVEHHADEPFESASLIKLGVLAVLAARASDGSVDLDEPMTVTPDDRAPADGLLQDLTLPMAWTARDLAVAMIVLSDNTATNVLLRRLGVAEVNVQLAAWGFLVTRSRGPISPRPPGSPGIGITTARECVTLLDGFRAARWADGPTSSWAMRVLVGQHDHRAMSRYLDEDVRCAHKTGTVDGSRHDVGVLLAEDGTTLATLAFLTDDLGPPVERHDHPAALAIGDATVRVIRALGLAVPLVPWAPLRPIPRDGRPPAE